MEKINTLYKGAGKGKIAAIIGVTSTNSFRKLGIKNVCLKLYRDYLLQHIGYDKVYIIGTSNKQQKINEEYFDGSYIKFGINTPNLFNDLNIDDIFCKQHAFIFFGGMLMAEYFTICCRLAEWYIAHGNNHLYTIQDDPDFVTINPMPLIDKRLYESKNLKFDPKRLNIPDYNKYPEYKDVLNNCFNNTIVAHCGNNYETFFNNIKTVKLGAQNILTEPKYWTQFNIYNWQGVNDNLENKFSDYPWEGKVYDTEYHGYIKNDKVRIKTTKEYYSNLGTPFMFISGRYPFFKDVENAVAFDEVPYNDLFSTICSKSKASFITANATTFNDFISPRYFDLMLSDIIAFVYTPYDSNKILTDNEELKQFMYVETPEEFREKVTLIANNEEYYNHIKYLQRKSIYDNFNEYMTNESKLKFKKYLNL